MVVMRCLPVSRAAARPCPAAPSSCPVAAHRTFISLRCFIHASILSPGRLLALYLCLSSCSGSDRGLHSLRSRPSHRLLAHQLAAGAGSGHLSHGHLLVRGAHPVRGGELGGEGPEVTDREGGREAGRGEVHQSKHSVWSAGQISCSPERPQLPPRPA
jgi:hypothetical protein